MALQEQLLNVPITGGINDSEDERLSASLQTMTNCRYDKQGTITKRKGYTLHEEFAYTTSLLDVDGKLHGSDYSGCFPVGQTGVTLETFTAITRPINTTASLVLSCDTRVVNGYTVYFWSQLTSLSVSLTAVQTAVAELYYRIELNGSVIVPTTRMSDGFGYVDGGSPKLANYGNIIYFVYVDNSLGVIYTRELDTTTTPTGALGTAYFVGSSNGTTCIYDLYSDGSIDWYVCYPRPFFPADLILNRINTGSVVSGGIMPATGIVTVEGIAIYATSTSRIWVAASGNNLVRVCCVNSAAAVTLAFTTVNTSVNITAHQLTIMEDSSTKCFVAASSQSGLGFCWGTVTTAAAVVVYQGLLGTGPCLSIRSKLRYINSEYYLVAQSQGYSNTTVLVRLSYLGVPSDLKLISILFPAVYSKTTIDSSASAADFVGSPCSFPTSNKTLVCVPASVSTEDYRNSLFEVEFDNDAKSQSLAHNGCIIRGGGVPSVYDGVYISEIGLIGSQSQGLDSGTGGGAVPAGTYYYNCHATYVNRKGMRKVAAPYATNGGGSRPINRIMKFLQRRVFLTNTPYDVFYETYRTTESGSVLYRLHADVPTLNFINVPSATLGYVSAAYGEDIVLDAALTTHPVMYTTGGVQPNIQPPSSRLLHIHNNRLWLADTPDGTIWYSKTMYPNEFPAFCSAFTIIPPQSGRVTAISSIDDKFLIFYSDAIWVIAGEGPNDTSAGSTFSTPVRIAEGIGCTDFRSVCKTAFGVFFMSSAGIQLLGRDLTVNYVGAPVEDFVTSTLSITAATDVYTKQEVRFATWDSDLNKGRLLVFDYNSKTWAVDDVLAGDTQLLSACMSNGRYYFMNTLNNVYVESETDYLDGAVWYGMTVETGEIHVNQIQGMQRVWEAYCLTKRHTAHGLTLTFYKDYSSSASQTETFAHADVTTAGTVGQFGVTLSEQECQSLRIKITDVEGGTLGTGQGCTITGLTLCIGTEGKITKRTPPAQRK